MTTQRVEGYVVSGCLRRTAARSDRLQTDEVHDIATASVECPCRQLERLNVRQMSPTQRCYWLDYGFRDYHEQCSLTTTSATITIVIIIIIIIIIITIIEAKDVLPNKPHAGRRKGRKCRFLSLVTLTFDLLP